MLGLKKARPPTQRGDRRRRARAHALGPSAAPLLLAEPPSGLSLGRGARGHERRGGRDGCLEGAARARERGVSVTEAAGGG